MMTGRRTALREHWETHPMPAEHASVMVDRFFRPAEMDLIRLGYLPAQMEDKWFIFFEDDVLYIHRSWTGFCIYEAHFIGLDNTWLIRFLLINRDPEQYTSDNEVFDRNLFLHIIEYMLLGDRASRFPENTADGNVKGALSRWSFMGRSLTADEMEEFGRDVSLTIRKKDDEE